MVLRLTEKGEIRRRLNTDRPWSLYALADLDDDLFPHCDWWGTGDALALVFRAIRILPVFVLGDASSTRTLLNALPDRSGYLNLKPDQLPGAEGIYEYRERHSVERMLLDDFHPRAGKAEPITAANLAEVEALYATGDGGGIAFAPFQLETGLFRGIRQNGCLVAVAGVQVFSRSEDVSAVGNVFTRPDCRSRGLAQTVTSAVVEALVGAGIETIGLNVQARNEAAIHAYRRLGFRTACTYFEGEAFRVAEAASTR